MWVQRQITRLQPSRQAVAFACPLEYGVSHLIQELDSHEKPVVWLELSSEDQEDVIGLGNKLAEAVNRVFETQLLSSFSYDYNLVLLQSLLPKIGPVTLVVTQAQLVPNFAEAVLKLHSKLCRVVIQTETTLTYPAKGIVIKQTDLALKEKEAIELVGKRLDKTETRQLWKDSKGAYDLFLSRLHQTCKLPPHLLPGPNGPRTLTGFDIETKPAALLKVLMRKKRWLEALELAAEVFPERVPEVLEEAGHSYHEQGLHKRLFYLLEGLPLPLKAHELVLYWRLQAAFRLGQEGNLRKEVEDYLKKHGAPELRALAAGVFVPTNRKEALRAYKAKKTPFTSFQLGRLTDTEQSIALLKEAVTLAENNGKSYEVVRNAGYLAEKLIARGQFQEAMDWSEWSLKKFDQLGVRDGQRRLRLLNDWAFTRILRGNIAGLEQLLKDNEIQLESAYPDLAELFRSTLGNYLIATSRPSEALAYYQKNLELTPRYLKGFATLNVVRAFLELGMANEALEIARQSMSIVQSEPDDYRLPAFLAVGISLANQQPTTARSYLLEAQKLCNSLYTSYWLAQIALYLALTYVSEGKVTEARKVLLDPNHHVSNLSEAGLRLLAGPENVFRPVWALLSKGKPASLELRFLGKKEVWLEGEPLKLFPSWLEILAVLAIEQRPLELEELMSCLYGDGGNRITLKSNLAKMRRILPISQHPYHIQGSFQADFIDVAYYLKKGNLHEAIKLYSGSLLKFSSAPSIRTKDDELSESLCNYALEQVDVEALMRLSELLPDDLRLLDKLSQSLDKSDPRASNVKARVEQIKSSWSDISNKPSQKFERRLVKS
jgi:tetratricopeptide (TPR) repeat protein